MIGYTTVGTNDLNRSAEFYDALFEPLGARRVFNMERLIAWGVSPAGPFFCVARPYDGQNATVGNGVMIALKMSDKKQVEALHTRAITLGATNEGDPGVRQGGFYCGYVRDLDGNKLNFYHFG